MPENSYYATLCSNVFVERNKTGNVYENKKIITFLSKETSLIHELCVEGNNCKYLEILSSPVLIPLPSEYISFKSYDEMFYTIKNLSNTLIKNIAIHLKKNILLLMVKTLDNF